MNLFHIGCELDDVNADLHRIDNLLHIYEEHIEREMEFLQKHDTSGTARYFVDRYDMLRSLLDIIEIHVYTTAESLQKQIDSIYAAHKETTQSTT